MAINNITQTISTIPEAAHRGIDVQTIFVTKQEDFQDHLQGTTVTELNTLKDQLNTRIGEINSTVTTMNGYADTASAGASTATTKAGEASASASEALTSRNQAETFAQQAQASAASVDVNNLVHRTGAETIAGVKTFSSNIVGNITGNAGSATIAADSNKLVGKNWYWSGQGGQPAWLWGGSDGTNMYVYNPSNFNVNYANGAGYATAFTTAVGSAPSYACRAWVNFNGTGTVYIRASGNVSSITDNGVGDYTVNFTTAMPDANYATNSSCEFFTGASQTVTCSYPLSAVTSRIVAQNQDGTEEVLVDLVNLQFTVLR